MQIKACKLEYYMYNKPYLQIKVSVMNRGQFKLCAKKRIRCKKELSAMMSVFFDGKTAYKAEIDSYGKTTNTVNRNIKKVEIEFDYCKKVMECNE